MSTIGVLLVDDHAVVRAGYRALLNAAPDIEVKGEAERGEEALEQYNHVNPDVVVMDLSLPGISGLDATRRIVADDPEARILVFSMHDDPIFVEQALYAGARGYITKNSAPEIMVEAISAVAAGDRFIDPSLNDSLAAHRSERHNDRFSRLTTREFQIFSLLAEGMTPQQVATRLSISYKTVANYTTQIKSKLKVQTTTELVHLALRHGIVQSEGLE